jgi:putative membrane protein
VRDGIGASDAKRRLVKRVANRDTRPVEAATATTPSASRDKPVIISYNTPKPAEPATRLVLCARPNHRSEVTSVQLSILVLNLVYAALGVVLMYVSYRIIDRLTPEVDFPAELKRGNVAVAIFIAALFIAIALIVGRAIS